MPEIPAGFEVLDSTSPCHELIGPLYLRRDGKSVTIGLHVAHKHLNRVQALHGGMVATLIDFAMGFAALATTRPERKYVTTSLAVQFAGTAKEGDWIEARPDAYRSGRRVVFIECPVWRGDERIAHGSGTFLNLLEGA